MGLLFFATLLGAAAGLGAWAVLEPFSPGLASPEAWTRYEVFFALIMAGFIGGAIGGLNGWNKGSKTHMLLGVLIGATLGALLGFVGFQIGGRIAVGITGGASISDAAVVPRMLGRMIAFSMFGAGIGLGMGASGRSVKRAWVGALGGLVGGLVAGALFDPISVALSPIMIAAKGGFESVGPDGIPRVESEIGAPGRAAMGVSLGAAIGLFTSIFLLATKTAWVRQVLGRNEGREWIIDAPQTTLGRSESAHIPLFGDNNVAPLHAVIERRGPQFILRDMGTPIGIGVNGQRVHEFALFDGAQIQIGSHALIFMMREGAARQAAEAARSWTPPPRPPDPGPASGPMPQPAPQTVAFPAQPAAPTQAHAAPQFALVILDGPRTGERVAILGPTDFGREGVAVSFPADVVISRRHASVSPAPDGLLVKDLGSTNGTFLNGARISEATIRAGDVVKMGSTSFRVERLNS
jgi:pSer/pThr/pTyr-binding forkhead associated (FHA) protein